VTEQPVSDGRFNVLALASCESRRGAVDAHRLRTAVLPEPRRRRNSLRPGRLRRERGALAAQVIAADRLRQAGEDKLALLFVVGEERGSDGALRANELPPGARYLLNGEPTGQPSRPRERAASCA
jgi:acetylornithine deacetylase